MVPKNPEMFGGIFTKNQLRLVRKRSRLWLVNLPPQHNLPGNKALLRAYENHWFPLIRPAIKLLYQQWLHESAEVFVDLQISLHPGKTNVAPEKWTPGKGDSYWTSSFLESMLVSPFFFNQNSWFISVSSLNPSLQKLCLQSKKPTRDFSLKELVQKTRIFWGENGW